MALNDFLPEKRKTFHVSCKSLRFIPKKA